MTAAVRKASRNFQKHKCAVQLPIDRPFAPGILKRARKIAESYQIVIEYADGEFYGRGLELPNTMNDGKTPDECFEKTRDILTTTVAYLLETGETPPSPASESKRTEQINFRLTPDEKIRLEEAARNNGFRGVSDFVRIASLSVVDK